MKWYRDPLLLVANSRVHIIAALAGTVLVFAGIFTLMEQQNPHLVGHAKSGYWVACYWAITTMTTTGYGDVSPSTIQGQFLACCLMLWSCFFLLPVVVAHVIQKLLHNPDAWTDGEQSQLLADILEIKGVVTGVTCATCRCRVIKKENNDATKVSQL